LENNQQMLITL
jgi:hypothetical protein